MRAKWKISIDTGGTFTDCIASTPEGTLKRLKVLSSSVLRLSIKEFTGPASFKVDFPFSPSTNFMKGFSLSINKKRCAITEINPLTFEIFIDRRIGKRNYTAEITTGEEVPVFACRLLTETPLHEHFPEIELKLGSTRGTNALLERKGAPTALLVTRGFKDLLLIGNQQRPHLFALNIERHKPLYNIVFEVDERIASDGSILKELTKDTVLKLIQLLRKNKIESVAVALINSYINPTHEKMIEDFLLRAGFIFVSGSHKLSPLIKILPRAETSVVNAYLDPVINNYIDKIKHGIRTANFHIMSSSGGLLSAASFLPKDSLLSGPAGGVMGAIQKSRQSGTDKIITFDMGGTSTDVSLCNGRPEYQSECNVANLKILSPSISIETIAAGGGSICAYDGFRLITGPHSAGASPGPACYGAGGPLTITDANLLLGRLDEDNFSIPVHKHQAETKLNNLVREMKKRRRSWKPQAVLKALIGIANEKMVEAIRKVSIQRGHDPREYSLLCFGGAGGQHACALASMLGINKIIVPYDAGLLSAYGIGRASQEKVKEKLVLKNISEVLPHIEEMFRQLFNEAADDLQGNNVSLIKIKIIGRFIFLRLKGQETSLEVEYTHGIDIRLAFISRYKKTYGHWVSDKEIEVESIRVIAAEEIPELSVRKAGVKKYMPAPVKRKKIFTDHDWENCPVYKWESLLPGASIAGPALLVSSNSTFFIENSWRAFLDQNENVILTKNKMQTLPHKISADIEEAELELFTNRFTSIAQNMGALLQRTSFSVNVKERLDFSCALLDAGGYLIVNAPHIPVHLGSLGVCVRELTKKIRMNEGDVIITNHPAYGGSHLPDITLVKPVYHRSRLIGFVANRAHHAEIGGKKPGSMPADAACLEEEGVVIQPGYLVHKNIVQWKAIEKVLRSGLYPSRAIGENLADLNGALASLTLGEQVLIELADKYGFRKVARYMERLKDHADLLLRKKISLHPRKVLKAIEYLDDGSVLKTNISFTGKKLLIDFTGSSPKHQGNLNATTAIVQSVVLYVLRILVNENIPLNEGLLKSVRRIIPKGSILNPVFYADSKTSPAVVGGNTEVSQRLTDTLLKALGIAACSQGTMNNFLFGNEKFGYYETICGGTGAGPGFNGSDAVHQHMTNTRITDPETLEFRYPVRLERFEIRKGSGGKGKWCGGNGVIREFYFKEHLEINILSQHRIEKPYGMKGGMPGKSGEQFIIRTNGKQHKLRGIDGVSVKPGDRIIIKTPGGGGWGKYIA